MTLDEAVAKLNEAGLHAKAKAGNPMLIIGGQGYEPGEPPSNINMFTGRCFFVYVKGAKYGASPPTGLGFEVEWMIGPQQGAEKDVDTLEEAVQVILDNIPPLSQA